MNSARGTPPLIYNPPHDELNVLHRDDDILVLSKPSGLLSVPGRGADLQDSLELRARAEFPEALLVHRLDMDTSGVFIMALNKDAQRHLGLQFEQRRTQKTYIAHIFGHPDEDAGCVDLPLRCDWENRPRQMVCYEHGKPAQTHWHVIKREQEFTRVELSPITGRSHQLRVHMAELKKENGGHPILGEMFYAPDSVRNMAPRLCLHAEKLNIEHPKNGTHMAFTDTCPF